MLKLFVWNQDFFAVCTVQTCAIRTFLIILTCDSPFHSFGVAGSSCLLVNLVENGASG